MPKCLDVLIKSARKLWKLPEISGIDFVRNFIFHFIFSIVSLNGTPSQPVVRGLAQRAAREVREVLLLLLRLAARVDRTHFSGVQRVVPVMFA